MKTRDITIPITAAVIVAGLTIGIFTALATAVNIGPSVKGRWAHIRIEEDQPGWDCEKMGNGVCGPVVDSFYVREVKA